MRNCWKWTTESLQCKIFLMLEDFCSWNLNWTTFFLRAFQFFLISNVQLSLVLNAKPSHVFGEERGGGGNVCMCMSFDTWSYVFWKECCISPQVMVLYSLYALHWFSFSISYDVRWWNPGKQSENKKTWIFHRIISK